MSKRENGTRFLLEEKKTSVIEVMLIIIGVFFLTGAFWAWVWEGVQCVGSTMCF